MKYPTPRRWPQHTWIFYLALSLSLGLGSCRTGTGLAPVSAVSLTASATHTTSAVTPSPAPTYFFSPPITAIPTSPPAPSPTPSPTPLACWSQPGRTQDTSLRTNLLPLPLEVRIHLPPCYDQQPERRYPVLYLIHGQNYNNDQWDRLGADETIDALAAAGEIKPFILVLPRDRAWTQPTENNFGKVVAESLIPWIDQNYRTLPDREFRAIGGLSRGAAWAVHLGLSRWELFGALGAHSLPVFWADTPHIRTWLDSIPRQSLPRIYLDTGEKDYLIRSTLWFASVLDDKGIPHEWYLFPGYHEEAYWEGHMERYIRWYARDWDPACYNPSHDPDP